MDSSNAPQHSTQPASLPNIPDTRAQTSPSTNSPLPRYLPKKIAILVLIIIALIVAFGMYQAFMPNE